jgi:cysteine sulfinate desulfinase/cysteine desulfurase-like protein
MRRHASTPIDPAVAAAMRAFLQDHYGNPSSFLAVEIPKAGRIESWLQPVESHHSRHCFGKMPM